MKHTFLVVKAVSRLIAEDCPWVDIKTSFNCGYK